MGSVAAARRTQSSYPTFLKSTNPSTLTMAVFGGPNGDVEAPNLSHEIKTLPDVATVRILGSGAAVPLTPSGVPRLNTLNLVNLGGSLDGYLVKQDRLVALRGQLFNPKSLDEVELTPGAARIWGVHVGQKVPIGFFARRQVSGRGQEDPERGGDGRRRRRVRHSSVTAVRRQRSGPYPRASRIA
jgi:hypothetical protein